MDTIYVLTAIAVMAVSTFVVRLAPFILPKAILQTPLAKHIADFTPLVIMVLLVTNAFKGHAPNDLDSILPIAVGIAVVAATQIWLRIPLISILAGVLAHILLLNL